MPSPTTVPEFLDLVRKSGVLEENRLDAYLDKLRADASLPSEPPRLAGLMVRDGLLTHFQAEQFLLGKWRRFTVGKYKVLEKLGAGGMGSVFLCEHKLMRRRVAVKVLPTQKAEDPASLKRFWREARVVAALDHPNIVRAYDIDQDENLHFLVMEHVDGSTLQEIVKKSGPMSAERAAHYVRQSALGLQHAHEAAGIVHRDIKPGNILVDRTGVVKVLDMGLARFFHDEEDALTKTYDESVLGTADYLAPEQALDSHSVDIRADIYSLGATFYYCLTGRTPFSDGSVAQKLIWHQTRQPKSLKSLRPDVPDGLIAVAERMMAKDPAQRYQDPMEVVDALAPWTQNPIAPPSTAEMPQLSRAAMGPNLGEAGSASGPKTPVSGNGSSRSRKLWQTNSAPAVRPATSQPPAAPTQITSTPPSGSDVPPPHATAAGPVTSPSPMHEALIPQVVAPAVVADESPSWEKLAGDTQDLTGRVDTSRNSPRKKPSKVEARRGRRGRQRELLEFLRNPFFWGVVGGAALVLVLLAFLIRWVFGSPTPQNNPDQVRSRVIRVNSAGGNADVKKTLREALNVAREGDHIRIETDLTESEILLDGKVKRLTIEGATDRAVVWRPKNRADAMQKMLLLGNAEEYVVQNLTLDGGGNTHTLIAVWGNCPGLKFHKLWLRGFVTHGIELASVQGSSERGLDLSELSFKTDKADQICLFFDKSRVNVAASSRFLRIRDCVREGPGVAAKSGEPKAVEDLDAQPGWAPLPPS